MDTQRLKIKRDVVVRYYVQQGDWIYAGPFDSKAEAQQALKDAKPEIITEEIPIQP